MRELPHAEYRWIDTAVGGAHLRNRLRAVTRWRPPAGAADVFRTWARFPAAMREHFRAQGGSVRGYTGPLYADALHLDVVARRVLAPLRG